jgi:hypothetical protein
VPHLHHSPDDYAFLDPKRLHMPSLKDHEVNQPELCAEDLMDEDGKILLRPRHRAEMVPYMGGDIDPTEAYVYGGMEGKEGKDATERPSEAFGGESGQQKSPGSGLYASRDQGMKSVNGVPNIFYTGNFSNDEHWEQCGAEQTDILCGLATSVRDKMLRLRGGGGGRGSRGCRSSSSASASGGEHDGGTSEWAMEEPEVADNVDIKRIDLSTMSWDLSAYCHYMRAVVETTRTLTQKIKRVERRNAYIAPIESKFGKAVSLKVFAAKEHIKEEMIEHVGSSVTFTFKFPKRAVGVTLKHDKVEFNLQGSGKFEEGAVQDVLPISDLPPSPPPHTYNTWHHPLPSTMRCTPPHPPLTHILTHPSSKIC